MANYQINPVNPPKSYVSLLIPRWHPMHGLQAVVVRSTRGYCGDQTILPGASMQGAGDPYSVNFKLNNRAGVFKPQHCKEILDIKGDLSMANSVWFLAPNKVKLRKETYWDRDTKYEPPYWLSFEKILKLERVADEVKIALWIFLKEIERDLGRRQPESPWKECVYALQTPYRIIERTVNLEIPGIKEIQHPGMFDGVTFDDVIAKEEGYKVITSEPVQKPVPQVKAEEESGQESGKSLDFLITACAFRVLSMDEHTPMFVTVEWAKLNGGKKIGLRMVVTKKQEGGEAFKFYCKTASDDLLEVHVGHKEVGDGVDLVSPDVIIPDCVDIYAQTERIIARMFCEYILTCNNQEEGVVNDLDTFRWASGYVKENATFMEKGSISQHFWHLLFLKHSKTRVLGEILGQEFGKKIGEAKKQATAQAA